LFLQNCDDYDALSVAWLHPKRNRSPSKDRGETEAVVQAAERGAGVLIDDRRGRELARNYNLQIVGTLGVLKQLFDMKLISRGDVTSGLEILAEKRIHLPRAGVEELARHVGGEN
jgi:hypothetical protein